MNPRSQLLRTLLLSAATLAVTAAPVHAGGPPSGQPFPPVPYQRLAHLKVVAIDAGHGGHNKGCLGIPGAWEKELTLQIARRVERILNEETTAAVLMTRRDDRFLGLRERTRMANRWDADVFLSIHLNADRWGKGHGVETWFLAPADGDVAADGADLVFAEEAAYGEAETAGQIARDAIDALVSDAGHGAARVASEALGAHVSHHMHTASSAAFRGVKQARFTVLMEAEMPAIVVECGFFSHAEEGAKLMDPAHQERVARGIVEGLIAYDRRMGGDRTAAALR